MILILGGEKSGRSRFVFSVLKNEVPYARNVHKVDENDICAFAEDEKSALDFLISFDAIIATEAGCGIVPADSESAKAREINGKLNIALADLASTVVLMTCGIAQIIKGSFADDEKTFRVLLVRHGITQANIERRYSGGKTDCPLTEAGFSQSALAKEKLALFCARFPDSVRQAICEPKEIFVSPMTRCLQTAKAIFPDAKAKIVPDFREMDFGIFENRSHEELLSDEKTRDSYLNWLSESERFKYNNANFQDRDLLKAKTDFAGERRESFLLRVFRAFNKAALSNFLSKEQKPAAIVIVAHGGTQMALGDALMKKTRGDNRSYFEFQSENSGFLWGLFKLADEKFFASQKQTDSPQGEAEQ